MPERQKVAIVTGASSGIGYATSIEFAKRGHKVFAGARRLEPMAGLREYGVIPIQLDITSLESVRNAKKLIYEHTSEEKVDFLFNNAGQPCGFAALDVSDEIMTQVYEVNVLGHFRMVREFAPWVISAKGVIGFTSSVTSLLPFPFSSMYASTKSAINSYAEVLRFELEPFEVKVLNFITGGVRSNIAETRPVPENSIYNVPGLEEAMAERREMAVRNNPTEPAVYARAVVSDFENAKIGGSLNLLRGSNSWFLWLLHVLAPRNFLQKIFTTKFKMGKMFQSLRDKYSNPKAA